MSALSALYVYSVDGEGKVIDIKFFLEIYSSLCSTLQRNKFAELKPT